MSATRHRHVPLELRRLDCPWSRPPMRRIPSPPPAPTASRWAWPTGHRPRAPWPGGDHGDRAAGTGRAACGASRPAAPRLDCTVTDTSTFDAGSVFQSRVWDFGDGTTLPTTTPASHHYAATALTTFAVKLTVTDAAGKVSSSSQSIVVAPPATTPLARPATALRTGDGVAGDGDAAEPFVRGAQQPSRHHRAGDADDLRRRLLRRDRRRHRRQRRQHVRRRYRASGRVRSGTVGTSSLTFPPTIRVAGDFANGWTLTFDDGFGGPGEPDFNDLVILIRAAP